MNPNSISSLEQILADLQPALAGTEQARLAALAKRKIGRFAAIGMVVSGGIAVVAVGPRSEMTMLFVGGLTLVLALFVHQYIAGRATKTYLTHCKAGIFREVVRRLSPELEYFPDQKIPREHFTRSGLFNSRIDRYDGEDCIHGKLGATMLLVSELHVQRRDQTTDSNGKTRTHWVTVFRGIYLVADFNKHFRSTVKVLPDFAEATFGWLGRAMQGLSGNLVRLESPEFERVFKVLGDDPVETRYLLTPDFQDRLLALRERWPGGLSAAFVDSELHLALPMKENWFEPRLDRPADDVGQLETFIGQVRSVIGIPLALDLDTRIWTK